MRVKRTPAMISDDKRSGRRRPKVADISVQVRPDEIETRTGLVVNETIHVAQPHVRTGLHKNVMY